MGRNIIEIPDSFAQLNNMTTVPQFLAGLPSLQLLNLGNNNFKGDVFGVLSRLERLIELDLNSNNFEGTIPSSLGRAGLMSSLILHSNSFTGSLPSELGLLTALTVLDVSENNFNGTLPSQLASLSKLTDLELDTNTFYGKIPQGLFESLNNLTTLSLGATLLGPIPTSVGQLSSLTTLSWAFAPVGSTIPTELGNLTALTYLDLHSDQLTGTLPTQLARLTSLAFLQLQDNFLHGKIPRQLCKLTSTTMVLGDNNFACYEACIGKMRRNIVVGHISDCSPTSQPSSQPSSQPTSQPSASPSCPSSQPTSQPSGRPSLRPSTQPSPNSAPPPQEEMSLSALIGIIVGSVCGCFFIPIVVIGVMKLVRPDIKIWHDDLALQLMNLPLHRAIMLKHCGDEILKIAREHPESLCSCFDKKTPLEYALEAKYRPSDEVLYDLIKIALDTDVDHSPRNFAPIIPMAPTGDAPEYISLSNRNTVNIKDDDWFASKIWLTLIQQQANDHIVEMMIRDYSDKALVLASCKDDQGRFAKDIASSNIRTLINQLQWLCRRFEILTKNDPLHKSSSTIVHFGE